MSDAGQFTSNNKKEKGRAQTRPQSICPPSIRPPSAVRPPSVRRHSARASPPEPRKRNMTQNKQRTLYRQITIIHATKRLMRPANIQSWAPISSMQQLGNNHAFIMSIRLAPKALNINVLCFLSF